MDVDGVLTVELQSTVWRAGRGSDHFEYNLSWLGSSTHKNSCIYTAYQQIVPMVLLYIQYSTCPMGQLSSVINVLY